MVYNAPNYRLVSTYIDGLADAKTKEDVAIDKAMIQSRYFDRNGLRGNQNELKQQLNDIMAQADYGRAPQPTRPTIIDKLNEGDPQDALNDKRYVDTSNAYAEGVNGVNEPVDRQTVNPYVGYCNDSNGSQGDECMRGRRRRGAVEAWSLTKTIVVVVVVLAIFYFLITLLFRDRVSYNNAPGDMNLPGMDDADRVEADYGQE